jgi:hypothetical protein
MIQLSFEPAYDAYHAMFRAARLLAVLPVTEIEYDKFRILDFYLCFPELIDQLRLKRADLRFHKLARSYSRTYAGKPDGRLAFGRMKPPQTAAAQTLAMGGYFDSDALTLGLVHILKSPPEKLAQRIDSLNKDEDALIEFIKILTRDYPLAGIDGLKHRSGLMEFRYDAV